jgi:uncharacterized Zn finger protein
LPPEPWAINGFWESSALAEDLLGEVRVPQITAALPKRLGNFPFWRGEVHFLEALEPFYDEASARGLEIFLVWS